MTHEDFWNYGYEDIITRSQEIERRENERRRTIERAQSRAWKMRSIENASGDNEWTSYTE